jgi:hypothetical protein
MVLKINAISMGVRRIIKAARSTVARITVAPASSPVSPENIKARLQMFFLDQALKSPVAASS